MKKNFNKAVYLVRGNPLKWGLALFLIIILVLCSGYFSRQSRWQRDVEIGDLSFTKLRYVVDQGDTTTIIGFLDRNSVIKGLPCKSGWIHFNKNWELKLFCLNSGFRINNVDLASGTWVSINQGNPYMGVVFPNNTTVSGFNCIGGGGSKGIQTTFYSSGKLREFFPVGDIEVGEIKCKGGVFNPVILHENGNIQMCTLKEPISVDGKIYKKGEVIKFDTQGNI